MSLLRQPASTATEFLIQEAIKAFGGAIDLPAEGEQFSDAESAFKHVQQYAFANGFAVVQTQKDEKKQIRVFSCVHYGKGANKRKLTGDAIRKEVYNELDGVDDKGNKLCQRQGLTRQAECKFTVTVKRLCYISGPLKGERMAMWTFKHRNLIHCNHVFQANLFLYPEHAALHPGNHKALAEATKHRDQKSTYRQHLRAQDPTARLLSESEYYNIGYQRQTVNQNQPEHIIERMMKALLDAGFHVRRRWVDIFEDNIHIRRLDQIFFISDALVLKSRRFCSDFVIEMDATFNTNILKMPLATVVGVDNHNRSFTAALSFIRSEAAEDYGFILNCLDQLVFYGTDTPRPQVLISDQSSGLRKAILSSETWSSVYHQLCGWHMVQNLKAFIQRNRRYIQSEDLHDIWTAIWDMVQSHPDELHQNKIKLFQCLYPEEVRYYEDNWEGEKEYRVLEAYACKYPNLGLRSTSRNEGQNSIIKTFLDHKMNLEQATRELIRTLSDQNVHDESRNAQSSMKRHQPGTVGMNGLRDLETILTMYAINLRRPEMHAAQQLELQNIPIVVLARTPSECPQLCKNSIKYGLPCRHIIQPFISQRRSLPRSLIHPRWFINPADADSSHPSFRDAEEEHYLTQAGEILLATEIFTTEQFQVQLPSDQAEEFATCFQGLVSDLRTEFQTPSNSVVTTFVPPPKKNKHAEELKRRAHGRAMARLPTSAELAEIEVRKRKRAMSTIVQSALPSTAPARLQFSGRSTKRVVTGHSSSEEICMEQSFESVTQDLELPWIGSGSGIASETQNTSIDLCELDTQEGIWIDNYASGRVVGIVVGEGTQMQDQAEGLNEESQLSWHDELDTQATVLL